MQRLNATRIGRSVVLLLFAALGGAHARGTSDPVNVLIFGPPGGEGSGGLINVLDQLGVEPGWLTYEFLICNTPQCWGELGCPPDPIHFADLIGIDELAAFDVLVINDGESNQYATCIAWDSADIQLLEDFLQQGGRVIADIDMFYDGLPSADCPPPNLYVIDFFGFHPDFECFCAYHQNAPGCTFPPEFPPYDDCYTIEVCATPQTPQWPYSVPPVDQGGHGIPDRSECWSPVHGWRCFGGPLPMIRAVPDEGTVSWVNNGDLDAAPYPIVLANAEGNKVLFTITAFTNHFERIDGPRVDDPDLTIPQSALASLFINAVVYDKPTCRVPEDYPTIQEAIDDCPLGCTIDVAPGRYLLPASRWVKDTWCSLEVDRPVTLQSRELYQAVLNGQGTDTVLLFIRAAAHIEGFVLEDARRGIYQRFSDNVTWTARNLIVRDMIREDMSGGAIVISDKYTRIGAGVVSNVTIDNCDKGFSTNDARGFDIQNCLVMNCSVAFVGHNYDYFNISYCDLFNNERNYGGTRPPSPGPGVIEEDDPLLVDGDVLADGYIFPYYPTCASPLIDAGDPDPSFNDVGFPLTLGTERNDIGAYGGPAASIELTEQGERDVLAQAGCIQPPIADASGPYVAECRGTVTTIALDGTGSSGAQGYPLMYEWTTDCPGGVIDDPTSVTPTLTLESTLGCLACSVTLTVSDGFRTATASTKVTVVDTTLPVIKCPLDVTIEYGEPTDPQGTGRPSVGDVCDPDPQVSYTDVEEPGNSPKERTITRTWTATDACGNTDWCEQLITVLPPPGPSSTRP